MQDVKGPRPWAYAVVYRREADEVHAYCEALPEAIAAGVNEAEAGREMREAIAAAVRGRIKDGMEIPMPDGVGVDAVVLPAQLAAKACVYLAWRSAKVSKTELAKRMGRTETEVRRVLDPDHGTKLDQLDEAARALGGRLEVSFAAG